MSFAHHFICRWKDGGFFNLEAALQAGRVLIISYDQTNAAYHVRAEDDLDFYQWVAIEWAHGDYCQDEEETPQAFFERIGISIRELK